MTDFHDPDRAAAVRRALVRLLDLVARAVGAELPAGPADPAFARPDILAEIRAAGPPGATGSRPNWPFPSPRSGDLR